MRGDVLFYCLIFTVGFIKMEETVANVVMRFRSFSPHLRLLMSSSQLNDGVILINGILESLVKHVEFTQTDVNVKNMVETVFLRDWALISTSNLLMFSLVNFKSCLKVFVSTFKICHVLLGLFVVPL